MNEEQIKLVKKTWKTLMRIDPIIVGDAFYSKLFNENPKLRKMFPTDMNEQYKKLIDMLTFIVGGLDRPEEVVSDINKMSKSHMVYGVKPYHFIMVQDALLWTIQKALGSEWNKEIETAWKSCYQNLSRTMMSIDPNVNSV